MDKPPEHDIARLLELESKLSRAIIGMQIHPALIDDESDAAPTR